MSVDFSRTPRPRGLWGGVAGGVLGSLLMNKKARKNLGSTAMTVGGAAALAGVAYYAYQKVQSRRAGSGAPQTSQPVPAPAPAAPEAIAPPPPDSGFLPPARDQRACDKLSLHLLQAMIAAAHADGEMDGTELRAVLDAVEKADLASADKSAVLAALNKPMNLDQVAALAESPQEAMELYAASLAAIDGDSPAEQAYLSMLSARLRLDPEVVAEMHNVSAMPAPV